MEHHQNGCQAMNETEFFLRKMVAMNLHRCIMGNFSLWGVLPDAKRPGERPTLSGGGRTITDL
jgi:hypothetical protein